MTAGPEVIDGILIVEEGRYCHKVSKRTHATTNEIGYHKVAGWSQDVVEVRSL